MLIKEMVIIKYLKGPIFSMCSGEHRKSQILFIFDGIFANASLVLTMGVFLSGYIVYLGGSDFLVGILNNSSTWASFVGLFSFLIFERREKRKKLLITLNIASRLLICSIIFLPLISKNNTIMLTALTVMVVGGNLLWGLYGVGSTVWLMDLLPKDKSRNNYIYTRMFFLRVAFTFFTILMGVVLDWFDKSYTGFLIVFVTSIFLSITDVVILMKIKEPGSKINKKEPFTLNMFFQPIRNEKFRLLLIFIFLFYFSMGISSSFTSLYQIRYLKLDYSLISIANVICYIVLIAFTSFWGRVEAKKGLKFVFSLTSLFIISELLIYSFLTDRTIYLIFLGPILSGIGYSGFNVTVMTYRFDITPKLNRTIYEGWFGAILGLSMLFGPICGSFIMNKMPSINNSIFQYSSFQLLYMASFVLSGLVVIFMLYRNKEFLSTEENA
jgi:MFS family permease